MAKKPIPIDKVRPSRDGHEFHEAWTARRAMQLLLPTDDLIGIAVEGLHPADQAAAASETVDIADIVLYYGKRPTFKGANFINIVQFKYSVSNSNIDFRVSDAKKTITKFAIAYRDHKRRYGAKDVRDKLRFELITNRPIYPAFKQAIASIADGKPLTGVTKKQSDQFKAASGLSGKPLVEFAGKCLVTGLAGKLTDTKRDLSRILVDWSATSDSVAVARLGIMRDMVRNKAGSVGTNSNVIKRVDVLAALDVPDADELLPCSTRLPEIGAVVEREQLAEAIALIHKLDKPLLVHADGGEGKTVFLDSLAQSISDKNYVLFFDCFGGGAYRAPEDSRHLPKRGLIHIVNTLACNGLCDPLLPDNNNLESLFRAFRCRLSQCVRTLSTASKKRELILFIDAIDNAAEHANDRNEPSFPTLLLESFHHNKPVTGVKLVVSCRPYRKAISMKDVPYTDFKLKPFSPIETEIYLRNRLPNVTKTEIQVAQARSGGNARILEHLVTSDRGLLDQSETKKTIKLDDLLNERIEAALSEAVSRGYKKTETNAFLAGLSVLPPPVPLDEYASAHGMDISAIKSFAADLAPLLEQTKYGLMFRDEPTETLIRESFGSNNAALKRVAKNLLNQQDSSVYAARALPGLLQKLDDGKQLFELAFDERFPASITSTVGKRNIRYARIKSSVLHAANNKDHNKLVRLLVELSTIAAVDNRGTDYILDYPDLVIAAQDVDATRRLFESRTSWPGTRHARLAIANILSGDFDNAYRHAVSANEWIDHYRQQDREHGRDLAGPERLDIAAVPFCLIIQNRANNAIGFMRGWKDWYAYEVCEHLFGLLRQAESTLFQPVCDISEFLNNTTDDIGVIASALSFLDPGDSQRSQLIKKLSKACKKEKKLVTNDDYYRQGKYRLQDGLLKASAIASSLGLGTDALAICHQTPHERPGMGFFQDRFSNQQYAFQFLAHAALVSAVRGQELREIDIIPKELYEICSGMRNTGRSVEFRKKLQKRLESLVSYKQDQSKDDKKSISHERKQEAEDFINHTLDPLLALTKAFAGLLGAPVNKGDKAFLSLLSAWAEARNKRDLYGFQKLNHFFQLLGCNIAVFALWARTDLKAASIKIFLERLHEQEILGASTLIDVVAILAKRGHLQALAGELAVKTKSFIENENEVGSRVSLYAQLARAILPASRDEAAAYFKSGLEQMDAIGSGDYQFTNWLLIFASSLREEELNEQDFHVLTNICELNMPYDEEKFPWVAFAKGLSRSSGCKVLAKLSRWDDRSKISLNYTLMPYLTALIDDGKIEPEDALALNRLSDPVEFYSSGTVNFAKAIDEKNYTNRELLMSELIRQFENNNSDIPMSSTVSTLASIASRTLGKSSETTAYLFAAQEHFAKVRDELNDQMNYHSKPDIQSLKEEKNIDRQNRTKLRKLATRIKSIDEASICKAVDEVNKMQYIYNLKEEFFDNLRSKVQFSNRAQYIKIISQLESIGMYTKMDVLKKCKNEWEKSSTALSTAFEELGITILQLHAECFESDKQLSGYKLKELSDLSGIPITRLALELIKILALADSYTEASVWLGLASFICEEADDGEGQAALTRLLNSNSAKLSSSVVDGEWKKGFYPANNTEEIASGLVWRSLGSPNASDRWRAAHSVRCFARFERWKVIDALVVRYSTENAHPFQAPELPFYYMHARLWLLIALSRIALDYPKNIAKYHKVFTEIILNKKSPHVLMRHFASRAILVCVDSGVLKLSRKLEKQIRAINLSPFSRLKEKLKQGEPNSYYQGRPADAPKPRSKFSLDYDFAKYNVTGLSDVFGKQFWEVKDLISDTVRNFDTDITSMHDKGGREVNQMDMPSGYHSYGQQLGWHSTFVVGGMLLSQYPVTDDYYSDEPWAGWFGRYSLTRNDGLWLSDGMDRAPLETMVNLLEKDNDGLVITGNKTKLLNLINVDSAMGKGIVVEGNWSTPDNIDVHISSVLVVPRKAKAMAKAIIQEDPFFVWLPTCDRYEYMNTDLKSYHKDFVPWIVCPSVEGGMIDDDDPLGSISTVRRPYFADNIIADFSISTTDPFGRIWRKSARKIVAHSDACGYESKRTNTLARLVCSEQFLGDVLAKRDSDLLVLVKLRRYEEGFGNRDSKFSHTVAVVRIKKTLGIEYYKGAVNKIKETKY